VNLCLFISPSHMHMHPHTHTHTHAHTQSEVISELEGRVQELTREAESMAQAHSRLAQEKVGQHIIDTYTTDSNTTDTIHH